MQHSPPFGVFEGMGAIVCEITGLEQQGFNFPGSDLFSRGVKAQAERRCPHCNAIIYSRRHKLCGVCSEPLPLTCLFSTEEAQSVASRLSEERARHRKWLHRFDN